MHPVPKLFGTQAAGEVLGTLSAALSLFRAGLRKTGKFLELLSD